VSGRPSFPPGFLHASPVPQGMVRHVLDARRRTFLRELGLLGQLQHAWPDADWLIRSVARNEEGYYAYPEYSGAGSRRRQGHELDGTTSIIIGMVDALAAASDGHHFKARIYEFLPPGRIAGFATFRHLLTERPLAGRRGRVRRRLRHPRSALQRGAELTWALLALTTAADMEAA